MMDRSQLDEFFWLCQSHNIMVMIDVQKTGDVYLSVRHLPLRNMEIPRQISSEAVQLHTPPSIKEGENGAAESP
jgi:hypothetical protein